MRRCTLAQALAFLIDRAELAQMLMCLLEMPADRLIVLDGFPGPALEPVGQARMQLRARALQNTAIGRVADQHVVEAQRRLAEEPADIRLDQLTAPQRFEPRVEVSDLARQEMGERRARKLTADDRGALQHDPLLGAQPLDAGGQQRLDRRRHLEVGELLPMLFVGPQGLVSCLELLLVGVREAALLCDRGCELGL